MECSDAKLKVQALVDNELVEKEIPDVINHIQSCYNCRDEYVELLKLQKKMSGFAQPEPPQEWFEKLRKNILRRISTYFGQFLFILSYIALIGFALYTLFSDGNEGLFIKIVIGGIVAGALILLGISVADRVRESKTDRYKGVIK